MARIIARSRVVVPEVLRAVAIVSAIVAGLAA